MENGALRNEFYKSRSLAGKLSAAFSFLNANFKYLIKMSACILIPLALVQALFFTIFSSRLTLTVVSLIVFAFVAFLTLAGILLFYSVLYTSIQRYIELGYIPVASWKELRPSVLQNAKKLFFAGVFSLLFYCLLIFISWLGVLISVYTLVLLFPVILFLLVPLSFFSYRYVFENEEMGVALKKSYRLGITYWGSTFAVILFGLILAGIVQLVASLPFLTSLYVEKVAHISVLQGNEALLPGYFPVMLFTLALVSMFISIFSAALPVVMIAFQYGSSIAVKNERENELLVDHQ